MCIEISPRGIRPGTASLSRHKHFRDIVIWDKRDDSDAQIRRSSNATVRSPAEVAVVPEISG